MKDSLRILKGFANRCRTRLAIEKTLVALMRLFSGFFCISLVLNLLFSVFPLTFLPLLWVSAAVLLFLFSLGVILFHIIRRETPVHAARIVEKASLLEHPSLSLALELATQEDSGSRSLKEQLYQRAASEITSYKKKGYIPYNKRMLSALLVLLILNIAAVSFLPNRLLSYWMLPFAFASRQQLKVEPGSITVPFNSSVTLRLTGSARFYPSANLDLFSSNGDSRSRHFLLPDSSGVFSLRFDSVKTSILYQFSLAASMPVETITVARPPVLQSLKVSLTPPAYTRQMPTSLTEGEGNMTVYAGTRVKLSIESSVLEDAKLLFGKDTLDLKVSGKKADGEFNVKVSGRYTFRFTDTLGQVSDSLPSYMVSVIPDDKPSARILRPGENKSLTVGQVETLWVEGIDDLGVKEMSLQWRKSGLDDDIQKWNLSDRANPPLIRKQLVWDLKDLSLYPGDTVYYWLRVRDNNPYRVQTAYSDTFWFRLPSFEEIHKEIAKKEQYTEEKLGQVRENQDKISTAVEKLIKSAVGSQELSWDQKRIMEDIEQQIKAQADSLQNALESLEKSMDAIKQDGRLNDELMEKMEQIRKTMEELAKEFNQDLMFQGKDQRQLSLQDMKKAAGKLQEMLPQLSERLDQTLQFLEMLKKEKAIADLALRAENLSAEQSELASQDSSSVNKRQEDLLDRIDQLEKDVEDQFNKDNSVSSDKVGDLSQQMRSGMRKGKNPDSKSMNAMSRELMKMSEELKSRLSSTMMAKMEEDRKLLLSMAHDALSLEEWQKLLRNLGKGNDLEAAKGQQALRDGLLRSMERSDSLSMVPPEAMGEIVQSYRNALEKSDGVISSLSNTDGGFQMDQSASALRSLANTLLSISSQGDSQDGSQGGWGMMSGLRRLSGRQAALNSMMGDMLQSLMGKQGQQSGGSQPGGKEPGGQQPGGKAGSGGQGGDEARREAQQAQKAIADELKRLAENYGKEAGENVENRVKELEKEARRLAALLENPPGDIVDQQDRFLSRMLQSTLSLNRKDEGKEERKGTRSRNLFSGTDAPPPGSSIKNADTFHLMRKRAFEDNFPESYRQAVREYFDALGEMYLREK